MDWTNLLAGLLLIAFVFGAIIYAKAVRRMEDAVDRLEALDIGGTLERMQQAAELVKDNLAESVSRADATEGPEGAAADAALRTGDTAAAIHQRQGTEA